MNIIERPADNYSRRLKQIADQLLSQREDADRLRVAATELYSLCSASTGIDEDSSYADNSHETVLPNGKALSPRDAASCVLDYSRTSKLLRGIHAAILEAQRRFPNTTIEILYAGCGPFAPLAIPLTSRFNPAEIRFTLLDIHRRSLDAAQSVFQAFGATPFVRDYIRCDAASYKHDAPHVIHIVVVEAMQAALEKEPQVAITINLAPQLCAGGIFIPERIVVSCHLCDPTNEFSSLHVEAKAGNSLSPGSTRNKVRVDLGSVLELTAGSSLNLSAPLDGSEHSGASLSPKVVIDVPKDLDGEFNLMLSTTINVYDSIVLSEYESGLTCPRILYELGKIQGGMRIEFAYHPGDKPGFKYRSLSSCGGQSVSPDKRSIIGYPLS
ncbi:MAG TPA: hypothetical protein VGB76_11420 [Pyrinomonadaceae bacterium]